MEKKVYLLETTIKNDGWVTEFHKNQVFSTMKAAQERLVKYYKAALKNDDVLNCEYNGWNDARVKYKEDVEYKTMFLTITPIDIDDAN